MNFWKSFGASMLAVGICTLIAIIVIISSIVNLATSFEVEVPVTENQTILYINLAEDITDAPGVSALGSFDAANGTFSQPMTLLDALAAIEYAATDSRIKGICIKADGAGIVSAANIEELRTALMRFKISGKFVVAYDDMYTQSDYYLASVAEKIILNPEGSLEWRGTGVSSIFYKGLLDKLDVDVEVFRPKDCRYKSGVEPFILNRMSDANRKQMDALVESTWQSICEDVSLARDIEVATLKRYASELSIVTAEDALSAGLIDIVAHEDYLFNLYDGYKVERNNLGVHNSVSLGEYAAELSVARCRVSVGDDSALSLTTSPLVAVIYAEGEIVDGDMYVDGYVYGSRLAAELRQARLDDKTKAVVVRVNSPGGSALASEVAWREMMLLQQVKPVVISMGSMAASGGYYISAPADYIIADKLTLTGSIGVFGVMFNIGDTLKNKIGITLDSSSTSPAADGLTMLRPLTAHERRYIERSIDRVYSVFTSHVAEGRNLDIEDVLDIAEGRVWSGTMAMEIGLVDAIGGFNEAISKAVELADIASDYEIYEFSAPLTPFEEWIDSMGLLYANMWGADYNIHAATLSRLFSEIPMVITNSGIQAIVAGDMRLNL